MNPRTGGGGGSSSTGVPRGLLSGFQGGAGADGDYGCSRRCRLFTGRVSDKSLPAPVGGRTPIEGVGWGGGEGGWGGVAGRDVGDGEGGDEKAADLYEERG